MTRTHTHTHVNGKQVAAWAPPRPVTGALDLAPVPACPKHCDTATPPEPGGGDQYVCTCCGTQFTWKGPPP